MRTTLLLPLALLACQGPPESNQTNAAEAQQQLDAPVKDVDAIPADETAAAAVGEGDDAPPVGQTASAPSPLPTHIPEKFWGRWGLVPADCTSTRGDAKGLLRIDDNRLYFYESKATLDRIIAATPTRFEANYGFAGEGQEWTAEQVLELNGNRLRRIGRGDQPVDLTYERCA